ncbi:MAG: 2-hydroxyacyl-CoA dehydratase family protein [Erysipelotrichaceae bacterium]|nr:2-hydroxyacyl-CoA dehydratase family protein [Erysipelotrichaceae bacterium]
MEIVKNYGKMIVNNLDNHSKAAKRMIEIGLWAESLRSLYLSDKRIPSTYKKLAQIALDDVRYGLQNPKKSVLCNIFTPVEILQCFDLKALSIECLAGYMGGFTIEDYFIDKAEDEGIASTLCSYHKCFLGIMQYPLFQDALMSVTTSTACDGNINTFRYLSQKQNLDTFVIDVPHNYSLENKQYVVEQLEELIHTLEEKTHLTFDENKLKEIIHRENLSHQYYLEYLHEEQHRYYPNTLTLNLYSALTSHLEIGSQKVLDLYKQFNEEVKEYPEFHGHRILWIHLMPYYQESIQQCFNLSEKNQIIVSDFTLDYIEQMDEEHPLDALAEKLICNYYNGDYERKVQYIGNLAKKYQFDGVIHMCHWGCKQSAGGVMLLKKEMEKLHIPFLILDGDCLDRRNCQDGQIKTRLEAFIEILDQRGDKS